MTATGSDSTRYDLIVERSKKAAKKAAASLRKQHKPVNAYTIQKETERLAKVGAADVRPISANTVRNHPEWKLVDDAGERRLFHPAVTPEDMLRMTRSQAIEQARLDRAWAEASSNRVLELEEENARLRLENRQLRKLA